MNQFNFKLCSLIFYLPLHPFFFFLACPMENETYLTYVKRCIAQGNFKYTINNEIIR